MSKVKVTTNDIARKVIEQKSMYLLDVRNESDFEEWKIEGEAFEYKNVPFSEIKEGVEHLAKKLPKDKDIIVACAKGISAQKTVDKLEGAGFNNVYPLEGGMQAWSEHLEPVKVADIEGGAIYQFIRLGKGCLSYMVISNGEAAVIDATRMIDTFKKFADDKDAVIRYTLDTHLHADHISGGRRLAKETNTSYYLPPKDATEITFDYQKLEEGTSLSVGNAKIEVKAIYSPGHTIGSTSLIVNNAYLLTGDILFIQSIGRPDLAGKADDWVEDLHDTLYETYKTLDQELLVLPAHYASNDEMNEDGTIGKKLSTLYQENDGLNVSSQDKFRKMVTENLPPQPNSHQKIRETNMGKQSPDSEEQREMEIGPNRCAIS
ncbi:MBL fold metallo-hydrolase [Gracilibacillus kekensis]|uniref:Glyoxylase, beta-lactamase superfamily II n=1 Tax=Gracilibacillus kekensis TaxID=1027249 RepID=A0A1M7QIX0_9BACI|nr:MBL fold metallo-hydrolase [Gracilibacillus kekensis]SHN30907.1 Glyoxylase, beta-lactamase superfamily II [Gracilibacillus kekensis]